MDKKPRRLWWLAGAGLAAAVLAGGYFFFDSAVVNGRLRPFVEKQLAQAVHSPVSIGSIHGNLTGDIVLHRVTLTVPAGAWEARVEVDKVALRLRLFRLFLQKWPLEKCLESLSFKSPKVTLARSAAPVAAAAVSSAPSSFSCSL